MVVYIQLLKFALLVIPIFRTFISDDSIQAEAKKKNIRRKDMTVKLSSDEKKNCILNFTLW